MSNAAYICGEKATDMRTGTAFDYRGKLGEVVYKNILVPDSMKHLNSTEKLWNAVEAFEDELAEKRYGNYKDVARQEKSLLAKERFLNSTSTSFCLEVSLPKEMSLSEHKELSDLMAKEIFGSRDLIVQYAVHGKEGNPHVHFASNFRPVIDGKFSESKYRFKKADIKDIRKQVADITNIYAKEKGYEFSIDHRSYIEQGIYIEPTKHIGWYGAKLADNSRIILENREILSQNTAILLESPEEMIKSLVQNKTVFTLDELKKSAKEKFGNDSQTWHVLKELVQKKSASSLIEDAAYFGQFLTVSHKLRDCALSKEKNTGDIEELKEDRLFIKNLRDERQLFASRILEKIDDYKWLMSRVGIDEKVIATMASPDLIWNDRSVFLSGDVPEYLRGGNTLSSMQKSFGVEKLDKALVSVFNLEQVGAYFKGKSAYISQLDKHQEEELISSLDKLTSSEFASDKSIASKLFGRIPKKNIESVIKRQEREAGHKLSTAQKEAAISLVKNNRYGSLIGKAGSGKTTTLRIVAASYQKAGFRVIGTSFQGSAVSELASSLDNYMDAGFTLSKLDKEWNNIDNGKSSNNRAGIYELTNKTVVIVDEASMVPKFLLQNLLGRAQDKGAKVICVGDTGQIASIDRADTSRLVLKDSCTLDEVRRQNNADEARASNYFANGFIRDGLEIYQNKGSTVVLETEFSSKLSLMHKVAGSIFREGKVDIQNNTNNAFKHLIIAYRNSDVDDFNIGMQRILKEDNKLGEKFTVLTGFSGVTSQERSLLLANEVIANNLLQIRGNIIPMRQEHLSYNEALALLGKLDKGSLEHKMLSSLFKPKEFYIGDKIRFTSNDLKGQECKKIYNGSLAIITEYDAKSNRLVATSSDGNKRKIDLAHYQGLDLGYAVTINRSQGKTVENSYFYLANSKNAKIGSKEFYVAATRHTDSFNIYTSKEYLQDKDIYQKIGEQWKINAQDLKNNPDLELVLKLEKTSSIARNIWSDIQKDVRSGKSNLWHHEKFTDYQKLKGELSILAIDAKNNWDKVRIYASEGGITLDDVERWIKPKENNMQPKENSKLLQYRYYKKEAGELWSGILRSKSSPYSNKAEFNKDAKLHATESQKSWNDTKQSNILSPAAKKEQYSKFNEQVKMRNKLAYELASFGGKEQIHDRSGKVIEINSYNHTNKSEWNSILRHSDMYIKSQSKNTNKNRGYRSQTDIKSSWRDQHIMLQSAVSDKAEKIAISLLGSPNKKLSTQRDLRFGDNGNLSVNISGSKSGTWYDFTNATGGDMFDLVRSQSGCNFKEAANYLRQQVGINHDMLASDFKKYDFSSKAKTQNEKDRVLIDANKQAKVEKLYARSYKLEATSIATKYLKEHRSITCQAESDIRQANIYINGQNYYLPALVAFARDKNGNITGCQQVLLDKQTSNKANIPAPKRSFGRISGSFVEISKADKSDITIIAEGVETALSIKQAGIDAKILCSLGVNNISNYISAKGGRIIIAADNDGIDASSNKALLLAKEKLLSNALVQVVHPKEKGDFNDILKQYGNIDGCKKIRSIFEPAINHLNMYSKDQVEIITSYQDGTMSDLDEFLKQHSEHKQKIIAINPNYDFSILRSKLSGVSDFVRREIIKHEIYNEFKSYVNTKMESYSLQKQNATDYKGFLRIAEQEKAFASGMYRDYEDQAKMLGRRSGYNKLSSIYHMHRNQANIIKELTRHLNTANRLKIYAPYLIGELKHKSLEVASENIFKKCQEKILPQIMKNLDKSDNKRSYLENIMHDKNLRPYVKNFAEKELGKINKSHNQQRLEAFKQNKQITQQKQQQQEMRDQKKHLHLDKGGMSL